MTHDEHKQRLMAAISRLTEMLPADYMQPLTACLLAINEKNPLRMVRVAGSRYVPTADPRTVVLRLCEIESFDVIHGEQHSYFLGAIEQMIRDKLTTPLYKDVSGWSIPPEMVKPIRLTQTTTPVEQRGKPVFKARRKNDVPTVKT
jgi:hypothetical protein